MASDYNYANVFHPEHIQLGELKFLVTGGAGFIGSHIVSYLMQHGAGMVRVLDNFSEGSMDNISRWLEDNRFELVDGDAANYDTAYRAAEGMDYICHQAALGSVPRSIKNPVATNESNVNGFLNVAFAAKEHGARRMVYASSSSVYGDHPVLPKVEHQIGNALSPYAVSKRVNELYADVFYRQYGLEMIGLRYFNIFGPRQSPDGPYAAVIPLFIQAILENKEVHINGDGLQTRDFTFVANAVQANIKAMFSKHPEAPGKVYNIALGERYTVLEMYEMLCRFAGTAPKATHGPSRDGDIRDSLASIDIAARFLAYNPEVKMPEGLKLTLNWYRQNRD